MAVDDAGRRGQQGGGAAQRWFEPLRLRGIQPLQIIDAVAARGGGDFFEPGELFLAAGDDQLPELGMRNPVLAAVGIKPLAAGNAAARLQAARRVIEPGMDDLAVAR
jgi:hypothetical protein